MRGCVNGSGTIRQTLMSGRFGGAGRFRFGLLDRITKQVGGDIDLWSAPAMRLC